MRLCIDLMHITRSMHITPPVTAEGYDGFHHPGCAECYDHVMMVYFPEPTTEMNDNDR